ncbi:MAG: hypothetical protein U1E53_33180 [Dongiaceae bacterium]
MTPGARLQAAIELLGEIHGGSALPTAAAAFFRSRRYIGGQDRCAVLDQPTRCCRRAALDWWIARAGGDGALAPPERDRGGCVIAALALLDGWSADRIAGAFDGGQYRPSARRGRARARSARSRATPSSIPAQPAASAGSSSPPG